MPSNDGTVQDSVERIEHALGKRIDAASRKRRRLRIAAVAGAGVLLGAATTGAAVVLLAPKEIRDYSVFCYSAANTGSVWTQVALAPGVSTASGDEIERVRIDALDTCAAMWGGGVIGQTGPPEDPNNHQYDVPNLEACVRNDGIAAVFPSSDPDLCASLGLRDLD